MSNHYLSFENYDFTYTYISGFVIDFISVPVTAGFCSAAAITIASSQLKSIFGLEISEHYHGKGDEGKKRKLYFTGKKIVGAIHKQCHPLGGGGSAKRWCYSP